GGRRRARGAPAHGRRTVEGAASAQFRALAARDRATRYPHATVARSFARLRCAGRSEGRPAEDEGDRMRGVILAGGTGSRLYPLTRVTNKHLLPVYDRPMIYYPLETLVEAGIRDILIVTGGNNAGDFLRLLRNGKDFGLQQLDFAYQEG